MRKILTTLALALLAVLFSSKASAATRTWDGGGANANWDTLNNWDNNGLPGNGDTIVFASAFGSGATISLNGNRTIGTLSITTATDFSLNNNILTISSGDITRSAASGTTTINSAITLGNAAAWNITGNLIVNGGVDDGGSTFTLTKSGTGTLTLSGNNGYDGTTTISGGVLRIDGASSLGGGNLTLAGGILGLGAGDFTRALGSGAGQVQWTASGGFAAYGADRVVNIGGAGATLSTGSTTLFGNSSSDFLILGAADATHTVTFVNGINFNTGSNARTIQVDNGAAEIDAIISGAIQGSSTAWNKTGAGRLQLTGNNNFTTAVSVNAGVLRLSSSTALGDQAGDVSVANGAVLELSGGISVGANESITSLAGSGVDNGGALRNISGDNTWGGAITLADITGVHRINSDSGTLTVGGLTSESGNNNNKDLTFGGSGNVTVSGNITADAGDMRLFKDGSGLLTLTGNNTFDGATTISGGVVNIRHANALGSTGNGTTVSSGAALEIQGGIITAAEGITLNGTGVANGGALRNVSGNNTNSGAISFSTAARINSDSGTLTLAGGLSGDVKKTFGGAGNITVGGAIGGSADVEYDGSGILALNGNNSYTGTTTVGSGGTVKLGHASALGTTDTGTTVSSGGVLDLNGQAIGGESLSLSGTGISAGGALINSSGSAASSSGTIALAANSSVGGSGNMTLSGDISGTGNSLTKVGSGTTTLSGNNSFTGGVLINGGVLQLGSAGALNSGTPNTAAVNSGTLRLNGNSITVAGLTGAGTVQNNHASTAATLTVNKASSTSDTFSGVIQNGGAATLALNKTGAGELVLSGANTFTGGTTLTAGTLKLGNDEVLANTGEFKFAGGILEANNKTETFGALSLTANSTLNLVDDGNTSALTFSGATWTSGMLTINGWSGIEQVAGDDDRIFIGGSVGSDFLNHVQFQLGENLFYGMMSDGELVPSLNAVPEPTEWALIIFAVLAVLYKFVLPRLRPKPALVPVPVVTVRSNGQS